MEGQGEPEGQRPGVHGYMTARRVVSPIVRSREDEIEVVCIYLGVHKRLPGDMGADPRGLEVGHQPRESIRRRSAVS